MIQLLIYLALFVASLVAIFAGLSRRVRAPVRLLSAFLLAGCIVFGAVIGFGVGWLIGPAKGGAAVGAIAFGEVGFIAGICTVVYRTTNHPEWRPGNAAHKPMALAIAIAIPLGALIAAPLGWALPIENDGERAAAPMATALLGAFVGVMFGIVYEKGIRGLLAILAIALLVAVVALVMIWIAP